VVRLSDLRLRAVRARMAEVSSTTMVPAELGAVRLRPHQRLAVARVAEAIARDGGCLLADDVGRGKTYVALAVARHWQRPLVVVPASLRSTWQHAMQRARVACPIVTHESLSRGALPSYEPDGIVVDESHRFRSLDAKRHATLARIAAHAPVLLLSATPLQNGEKDLAGQLALFLGSAVLDRGGEALARYVVRSPAGADAGLPAVAPPVWLRPERDDGAVLRAILALPPPARPFDAGDAGALRTIGLVRAWASSRAALVASLRNRQRLATALEQCASSGLAPSRRDLDAWQGIGGDLQLALAPLLVSRSAGPDVDIVVAAVTEERAALDKLQTALGITPDPDVARIESLRALRVRHPAARILAFSEYAATVRAYFALLRADNGIGMLTASEARIASGRLPREALLARFAPRAQGAPDPALRERVTLLLATDLLSEGVNLQDASVVVHLDLPWNPARLAQRLGRVRRPGGAAEVCSYLMAPPASTELLLRVDARLRAKLARAEHAVGRTLNVLPVATPMPEGTIAISRSGSSPVAASAEALGAAADEVLGWRRARAVDPRSRLRDAVGGDLPSCDAKPHSTRAPLVAAVTGNPPGWLAALDDGRLLARHGDEPPDCNRAVVHAISRAMGMARGCAPADAERALEEALTWLERERVARECGVVGLTSAVDDALERRITRAARRAPRHERARVLALSTRLRAMLGRARSLGAERELELLMATHAGQADGDLAVLQQSVAVAQRSVRRTNPEELPRVVALIVFVSEATD
jgi:superfamily II DNA or RNA helicase